MISACFATCSLSLFVGSGGISLKPSPSMDAMRADMGGAATVCASIVTAAALKLPVNIIGELLTVRILLHSNPESMKNQVAIFKIVFLTLNLCAYTHLSGLAPLCENMPSGKATKPGDVVRAKNGKTIQVGGPKMEVSYSYLSVMCATTDEQVILLFLCAG